MIENDRPMPTNSKPFPVEPLRAKLSDADDRIRLNHWMPPQNGIAPRIRIGRRWINTLWGLPIAAAALLGFKMVKWIAAIEFVQDFADLGAGQGGYNEDHEFYGYRMPI